MHTLPLRIFSLAVLLVFSVATQCSATEEWSAIVWGRGLTVAQCSANFTANQTRLTEQCVNQPGGGIPFHTEIVAGRPELTPMVPVRAFVRNYYLGIPFTYYLAWNFVCEEVVAGEPEPEESPVEDEPEVEEPTPVESPVTEEVIVEEPSPVESPVGTEIDFGVGPLMQESPL